jgi:riboflavin kinase/FMN adenylyltransferase
VRIIRSPRELRHDAPERLFATVGNFDGVHLGHRAVIAELMRSARAGGGPALGVTFEPHPVAVVGGGHAPSLLTPGEEKLRLMASAGLDVLLVVEFTPEVASMDAATFLAWLGVGAGAHLVLGYDFRMGRDRSGDASHLSELGSRVGFGIDVVPPVIHAGAPISSSRIRDAVSVGEMKEATAMLGRPYALVGRIVPGEGVGRSLGSPTANLEAPAEKLLPADGVYFATADSLGGLPALLYVGTRPTLGGGERRAEAFVLDFDADLLGELLEVGVRARLRPDAAFGSAEELRRQIKEDTRAARDLAARGRGHP